MRNIIMGLVLVTALQIPFTAQAEVDNLYGFQVQTSHSQQARSFWAKFWERLQGNAPLVEADLSVKVLDDDGSPLSGASVLVGSKKGDPFAANFAQTDSAGMVVFSDETLKGGRALTVTASKSGYGTFSLMDNTANVVEIRLVKFVGERDFSFLSGKVTGFPTGYDGSTLELGLFLPAFRPESLMNFDPQQFVSSYKEKINVFGEREVPGNLVLPPQRKRYGIIPISISKPGYTMPLAKGMTAHMSSIAGAVNIGDAMDALKAKDFLGAINLASFTHVGWTNRRVEVRGNESFDLPLAHELTAGAVTAQLSGVQDKLDAVAVSVVDPDQDQGDFIPMDVKAVKSEQVKNGNASIKVATMKQRKSSDDYYVFAGVFDRAQMMDKDAPSRAIVGALAPVSPSKLTAVFKGFFKPMKSLGVGSNNRDYRFSSPANAREGLAPTLLIFNVVSEKKNETTQGLTRNVIWSAVLTGNAERVTLPDLGKAVLPNPDTGKGERFVWEVIAVKTKDAAQGADLELQSALRNLQHVSSLSQKY